MDCSEYLDLISDEIDGEIGQEKALDLMRHLVRCDSCRSEYSELNSISEMVRTSVPEFPLQVPSGFSASVVRRIEEEIGLPEKTVKEESVRGSVFEGFLDKARAISFPVPSLSWSFAASLLLVASLTFFYKENNSALSPHQMMTDAKVIKARVLTKASMPAVSNAENDFNYYVKKHVRALRNKPVNSSIRHSGAVISYASHESGALRVK